MAFGVKIVDVHVVNVIVQRVIILPGNVHEGVLLGINYLTVIQVTQLLQVVLQNTKKKRMLLVQNQGQPISKFKSASKSM
jgi:hypothetical protein